MTTIALDRRFIEWGEGEPTDPDLWAAFGASDGFAWPDLLQKRRIVILAEAGSGKTEELKAQARLQSDAGQFGTYAKLQDVAQLGLDGALRHADRLRLAAWRTADQPGWLFIDSVDEAKLDGVRFERALRQLADGIRGAERRAHIIISGRITDWEFRRDLTRLGEELPVPPDARAPPPPMPDEILIRTIRHNRSIDTPAAPESPLVVVMASLDAERIRRFAEGKNTPDLDSLMGQIEAANLWRFARRPLDLEWLVDFWQSHRRLGTLAAMLETSLLVRLQEPNRDRARRDPLDAIRVRQAVERVGAALVFARKDTIAIPDDEISRGGQNPPLDLAEVLPDWSAEDLTLLLARPIFDPATFGRVRLHNDNEGVVRSYVAARWLLRLHEGNLPVRELLALLFAERYGVALTKPSMRKTAAWLSIWLPAIASELTRREPAALLTCGDPASLSAETRRSALTSVIERLVAGDERLPHLDNDTLKRFARGDIADTLRSLWGQHGQHEEVRHLLLRLIWLGQLQACADLAVGSAFGAYDDRSTQLFAGLAVTAAADDAMRRRYVAYIVANCCTLPAITVWNCVDALFPDVLGADELRTILSTIDVTDWEGANSFDWHGPKLMQRLRSRSDLEKLLQHLVELTAREREEEDKNQKLREYFLPSIAAGAFLLLERCSPDEAPTVAIDGVLRLGEDRHHRMHRNKGPGDARELLQASLPRRRAAFWRAVEVLRDHEMVRGEGIVDHWHMEMLGWAPQLGLEDLDWLLADGPGRLVANDRRLAVNTALQVWRQHGSDPAVLQRIEAIARKEPAMSASYDAWMVPRVPSGADLERQQRLEELQHRNALEEAAVDRSWREFIARLRADPGQLQQLRPPSAEGVDSRLYHLWRLLSAAANQNSRYAIESVAPLEPMLGAELAAQVCDALIGYWRRWRPRVKSEREPGQQNFNYPMDCMGIAGITLEANRHADWAQRLSANEAQLAARYATLELNGLPSWLSDLAAVRPREVCDVVMGELLAELDGGDANSHYGTLQDLTHAEQNIIDLVTPRLLAMLERRPELPMVALRRMLEVLSRGRYQGREQFTALALRRFSEAADFDVAAHYFGAAFSGDVRTATSALVTRLDALEAAEQTALGQRVLPVIFGDRFLEPSAHPRRLHFESLVRLVRVAFRTIRIEEDRNRRSGVVFSPDGRDHAEHARSAAFNQLVEMPGRATYDELLQLAEAEDFPLQPSRLRALAVERAAKDSESDAWPADEAYAFELSQETAPRTARDLQILALRRIDDMQHELLHDDFAQGATLSALPNETAVQNWLADRLRLKQGRAYSVEREPHVVGEKEPDVRLRARPTDASVPVEIKVIESWSVLVLEAALSDQLCGQYLRAREGKNGILLLVHQERRPVGWEDPDNRGTFLTFEQVMQRLQARAAAIAGASSDAPQPEIAVLNVATSTNTQPRS